MSNRTRISALAAAAIASAILSIAAPAQATRSGSDFPPGLPNPCLVKPCTPAPCDDRHCFPDPSSTGAVNPPRQPVVRPAVAHHHPH